MSAYLAPHQENKYFYNAYAGGSQDADTMKARRYERIDFFNLYKTAFGIDGPGVFSNTRIIRNYPNPGKYDPDEVQGRNMYDYELVTRRVEITNKHFYRLMRDQLDTYFGVTSSLQKRKIACYVLRRTGSGNGLQTKGGTSDFERRDDLITATNVSLAFILESANIYRMDRIQLVDETGFDTKKMQVDWRFDFDFEDNLPAIQKSLAAYGLSVTREEREMDCIVLDGQ